jgi:lactam utilization protein B
MINHEMQYCKVHCALYNIEPFTKRLGELAKLFFHRIYRLDDRLSRLLPAERPTKSALKLRQTNKLSCYVTMYRTNRFHHSFLPYTRNFQ